MINIASCIENKEFLTAIIQAAKEELQYNSKLQDLLVYLYDIANEKALPNLGEQLDVLGYNGWFLAKSTEQRRELLQNSVKLHSKMGTPWAVKEALRNLGFPSTSLIEGYGILYNNEAIYDGIYDHGGSSWSNFAVKIDIGDIQGISTQINADVSALINNYKNVRSTLVVISYRQSTTEFVEITEDLTFTII